MIKNLSAYNAWKRSTLDRLTAKYHRAYVSIYRKHLESLAGSMETALNNGITTIEVRTDSIARELAAVLLAHQQHVITTGVSDGMREADPEKSLSTWENFPYWYPVEETFTNLAERKVRDTLADRIRRALNRKNKTIQAKILSLDQARFIKTVKAVFRAATRSHFEDEDSFDTKKVVLDVIKTTMGLTSRHTEMIYRTETTRYFNDARVAYFQENTDVDFVRIVAITDGRISDICESRVNYVIPISKANLPENKPPFHPNCRSVLSPLVTILSSATKVVTDNLGSEFGSVHSASSDKTFVGKRKPPLPLPPSNLRWKHA